MVRVSKCQGRRKVSNTRCNRGFWHYQSTGNYRKLKLLWFLLSRGPLLLQGSLRKQVFQWQLNTATILAGLFNNVLSFSYDQMLHDHLPHPQIWNQPFLQEAFILILFVCFSLVLFCSVSMDFAFHLFPVSCSAFWGGCSQSTTCNLVFV